MRRAAAALAAALVALGAFGPALSAAVAAPARASLTDIESEVMCPSCHEPLEVAQSPQAEAERNYIRGLIAQGLTKPQIERELVAQYGTQVLGKPPAHGFNLAVYILPPAAVLIGIGILAFTLPRWRRRARAANAAAGPPTAAPPTDADVQRLDEDLAAFRG